MCNYRMVHCTCITFIKSINGITTLVTKPWSMTTSKTVQSEHFKHWIQCSDCLFFSVQKLYLKGLISIGLDNQ